ncbi:MAG: hypothetical protein JXR77_08775, partial [Lentisphaeria bacterium]|nr:hypothetical protein [Lentisphaeria bacterium]
PAALASPAAGPTHAYSPPRDLEEWTHFMRRIVEHCNVERDLGIRYWVTMLNEADIPVRRGQAQWDSLYDLYERTTRLVKAIDPNLKVGGPATCGPLPGTQEEDIRSYLRFCRARDLPPDFLCFHAYGRPHPREYEDAILAVRRVVAEEWPGLRPELFLDEWNLWGKGYRQNSEYAAAYLAAAVHYQIRAGLSRSCIVSFNSHLSDTEMAETGRTFQGPFRKGDAPGAARFHPETVEIEGKPRRCLYTHSIPGKGTIVPYTFGRFQVALPREGCILRTGTALALDYPDADGCGMSIVLRENDRETLLLTTHARAPRWEEHEVDLSRFSGRAVAIEFRTDCGRAGDTRADHGLWGSPVLAGGDETVFDFCVAVAEATTGYVSAPGGWHEREPTLPLIKGDVVTPAFFTYVLLDQLRGERLPVHIEGADGIHAGDTDGALACRDGAKVRVLLWHFDAALAEFANVLAPAAVGPECRIELQLAGLGAERCRLSQRLVDAEHSNVYTDAVRKPPAERRAPENLDDDAVEVVDDRSVTTPGGRITLPLRLRNLSVTLLEMEPE